MTPQQELKFRAVEKRFRRLYLFAGYLALAVSVIATTRLESKTVAVIAIAIAIFSFGVAFLRRNDSLREEFETVFRSMRAPSDAPAGWENARAYGKVSTEISDTFFIYDENLDRVDHFTTTPVTGDTSKKEWVERSLAYVKPGLLP